MRDDYGTTDTCGTRMEYDELLEIKLNWRHLVGVLIAPKSRVPCAVYLNHEDASLEDPFVLMSPNRNRMYAMGYLEEPRTHEPSCNRQHAIPGLCTGSDLGFGFGTTLYLAGAMVTAAAEENWSGDFPFSSDYGDTEACTFSIPDRGERTPLASGVWESLIRRGVAERTTEQLGREWRHPYDILTWPRVLQTGLVLYLGRDFRPGGGYHPREIVPPEAIGTINWSETPANMAARYIEQNADLLKGKQRIAYLRECARGLSADGWDAIVRALPTNNPSVVEDSSNYFDERNREWLGLYAAGDWA